MAELQTSLAPRGRVYYSPLKEIEPIPEGYLQGRRIRPQVLRIGSPRDLQDALIYTSRNKNVVRRTIVKTVKLALSKAEIYGIMRRRFGPGNIPDDWEQMYKDAVAKRERDRLHVEDRRHLRPAIGPRRPLPDSMGMSPRSSMAEAVNPSTAATAPQPTNQPMIAAMENNKPVASGNGVQVSIVLAEPVLFLQGFDTTDFDNRNTTMLRGHLRVRVTKTAKIKAVTLKFRGKAETEWPEGIPPKKLEYKSSESLMNHTWTFFNAMFSGAETSHGADTVVPLKGPTTSTKEVSPTTSPRNSQLITADDITPKEIKRLSLQEFQLRNFGKSEANVNQKGYRMFTPGDYIYHFELPIDSRLPESINVELGNVRYDLEAIVERAGAFRANLVGSKEVTMIRAPTEGSLEMVEPIAISRDWENQLHYDIVISGKSFPLGAQVPIAFKLTPLAKVRCHRIKVYLTENVQYFTSNKRVHRMEPTRRIQLFEKRSDGPSTSTYPGSSFRILAGGGVDYDSREAAAAGDESVTTDQHNLLGSLDGNHNNIGPSEFEMSVQLPSCTQMAEKDKAARIHFDTTYTNIQVHHWIKIVMRLSRPDSQDPTKQRHFEISIDSPFHILSCQVTQANMSLPAYDAPGSIDPMRHIAACGCADAMRRRSTVSSIASIESSTRSSSDASDTSSETGARAVGQLRAVYGSFRDNSTAMARPMHLLRAPSFNPPPWSDHDMPPPLVTPPPQYETAIDGDPRDALADYFTRLADDIGDDEDDVRRVDLPLTPGGRINRSMDAIRSWTPVGAPIVPTMPAALQASESSSAA